MPFPHAAFQSNEVMEAMPRRHGRSGSRSVGRRLFSGPDTDAGLSGSGRYVLRGMEKRRIAVVGLGYVGLPLAIALARKHEVIGFDISEARITEIRSGADSTGEVDHADLVGSTLVVTGDAEELRDRDIYIVTVPTPIDDARRPDFTALLAACHTVGSAMRSGAIVVFESTVYPGVTEEICGPALELASGMRCGQDFRLAYSPERINPGDRSRPLEAIIKVVAGQDSATLDLIAEVYGSIVDAGIHRAPSIKVAEAAKVIENSQRDLNIALMNELAKICDLIGIRTTDVLAAAGTKWNFLKFHPGLVGGHCIGVDPYYLTAKAEELGYHPEVILAGRRINDSMGAYVAQKIVKRLAHVGEPPSALRVGILGFTFKEGVPDIRNNKVIDIVRELQAYGISPIIHDPLASPDAVEQHYQVKLSPLEKFEALHALVLAVPHQQLVALGTERLSSMIAEQGLLIDLRSVIDRADLRPDIEYWSL